MNEFRKLGLISYNGHIEVNSALLDAVLRDKPELKRMSKVDAWRSNLFFVRPLLGLCMLITSP
jgi:hypothetical protein